MLWMRVEFCTNPSSSAALSISFPLAKNTCIRFGVCQFFPHKWYWSKFKYPVREHWCPGTNQDNSANERTLDKWRWIGNGKEVICPLHVTSIPVGWSDLVVLASAGVCIWTHETQRYPSQSSDRTPVNQISGRLNNKSKSHWLLESFTDVGTHLENCSIQTSNKQEHVCLKVM